MLSIGDDEAFNHDDCLLLRFPPQLRDSIYRSLFGYTQVYVRPDVEWKNRLPAVLLVCRQSYADTKLLLWARTESCSRGLSW